jgi:hypothetical protein
VGDGHGGGDVHRHPAPADVQFPSVSELGETLSPPNLVKKPKNLCLLEAKAAVQGFFTLSRITNWWNPQECISIAANSLCRVHISGRTLRSYVTEQIIYKKCFDTRYNKY